MKTMKEHGVEWTYRPGLVYTALYRGFEINIRHCPPMDWMKMGGTEKRKWRLHVTKGNGGSIAFNHQFYASAKAAKAMGIALVDQHPAALKAAGYGARVVG